VELNAGEYHGQIHRNLKDFKGKEFGGQTLFQTEIYNKQALYQL
jgi:hypothetical protein